MNKRLESYVGWLNERLQAPLPGKEAQLAMKPRNVDATKFRITSKHSPKEGSVLILLYPKAEEIFLALMKRPEYEGVHGGQISFPGGKKEAFDPDLIATAIREGEEEVGIVGSDVSVVGQLSEHFVFASNFNVLPVVGYLSYAPQFYPDNHEVEEVVEVSLDHLLDANNIKEITLNVRDKYPLIAPYYDVHGHVVWGATAMIMSEFLVIAKEFKF